MADIRTTGACEGNLKNLSPDIPKQQLVVFAGRSGSGKSTLLVDVLFNECQRQCLEALAAGHPKSNGGAHPRPLAPGTAGCCRSGRPTGSTSRTSRSTFRPAA